jgi:competence protein ComEC
VANPFLSVIDQVLPQPQAGLLAGILFGTKVSINKELLDALLTTGTIHLVALSGQNISILVNVFSSVTLILGRKLSVLISCVSIIIFIFFVGPSPTVIRAGIMGIISLLSVYFGRKAWSLLSLIIASGLMLLAVPALIENISFQLSCVATFGIIIFGPSKVKPQRRLWGIIVQDALLNFQTTLAAQVFTVPIILFHFKRFSLIAPITNVLVAWTITPIMVLGLVLSVLGYIWLPLGEIIAFFIWLPINYLILMIKVTALLPFASFQW